MRISLNGNDWRLKGFYGEDWVWRNSEKPDTKDLRYWYRGTVPGSVHQDLWNNGLIPDPYYEQNSLAIEWVPTRTWIYKKRFPVDGSLRGQRVELRFEGVDYEAQFSLNGTRLGAHRSMFTPVAFDVTDLLLYGGENELAVVIEPAPDEQPQVSKTSRVKSHKSRMTYWWDFCPRMIHQGIWDDVYLEATGPVRVEDVFVRPRLGAGVATVDVAVTLSLWDRAGVAEAQQVQQDAEIAAAAAAASAESPATAPSSCSRELWVTVSLDGQSVASRTIQQVLVPGTNRLSLSLPVAEPQLWWPNGEGEQPLYTCTVSVPGSHEKAVTFGIRQIELAPNWTEDHTALSYTFVVNGRKVYVRGWNWVPMDVLYGVERPEKLERLLQLARRAGVNMLRVWGGGLIEKDAFYSLCDRYGIMVWQEFIMSSSGVANKPSTDPAFIQMMAEEAEGIIPRKRNHPSLALWCGGNELSDLQGKPLTDDEPVLAAIHGVIRRLDPDRIWLPTSPTGRQFGNTLTTIEKDAAGMHDVHGPWEHQGLTAQYTLYNKGCALLHSEFGAEGMTNRRTLNRFISPQNQWPASRDNPVWFHRGAWWTNEPLVQQCFGGMSDIDSLQKASQFLQHEALRYALESDRLRAWQCSGTLPWQFNEPYPNGYCTSAVDYYALPKPGYWAVAGAYEAIRPAAKFPTQAWAGQDTFSAELWVMNATPLSWPAVVRASVVGASGRVYLFQEYTLSIEPNGSTAVGSVTLPLSTVTEELFFLDVALGGETANRYLFTKGETLAPMLTAPTTTLDAAMAGGTLRVRNTGAYTALYVRIDDARPVGAPGWVYTSDDYFPLLPGESRAVAVEWSGVPAGDRRLAIGGWNTEVTTVE